MLDIVAWHGSTKADHKASMDSYGAKGYRTLSLSIYNTVDDPRYACVLIRRPVVVAERQFFDLNAASFQSTLAAMATEGMGPNIVSATGPSDDPLIAAVFIPVAPQPVPLIGLTASEFSALNGQNAGNAQKLMWFDCYGASGEERYIAVWWPDPEMMAWNCDGVGESTTQAQQRFDSVTKTWARCAQVVSTPSGNITALYTDGTVGTTEVAFGISADAYQNQFKELTGKGLVPLRVCVQGPLNAATFWTVFGETEETNPRTWGTQGLAGQASIASVDSAIEAFMKGNAVRNAALAIVNGTRLVYAKGYTLAEPSYVDVQPTTLFRLASCSKVFTAYALYRLLQQRVSSTPPNQKPPTIFDLLNNTTLQSVLNLKQPNGSAPADPKFCTITLLDLITSTSGLDQGLIYSSVAAAQAAGATLPATRAQLASYGAAQTFSMTPGDPHNVVYGNFDYFLLGEVVRILNGSESYEAAVESLIMQPLGLKGVRGARSLLADQLPNEASYHMTQPGSPQLAATASTRTSLQPLVAEQYGGYDAEMLGACGGLSATAVDMARILASLSAGVANPVLTADTVNQWMVNAALATTSLSGPDAHGYHGWDGVFATGNGAFTGSKGGWLRGVGTEVYFTTGGMSYIYFNGTNSPCKGTTVPDWHQPLVEALAGYDWGTTDLFPSFGMSSF